MDIGTQVLFTGIGATALMDAAMVARERFLGIAQPDYGLVGRWLGHMARGRFAHSRIAAAPAVKGERAIGWAAHYAIGIAFAGLLYGTAGAGWFRAPTIGIALAVGVATVAAPFLVMQPAMGAGFAASRTPRPNAARAQSLVTHALFGLGLYGAGLLSSLIAAP
jgi:hypothetical protein